MRMMTSPLFIFSSRLAIRVFVSVSFASIFVPLMVSACAWSSRRSSASSINFSRFENALAVNTVMVWSLATVVSRGS